VKKTVLLGLIGFILFSATIWWFWPHQKISTGLNNPLAKKEITPSDTLIDYQDPAGFSFSYPDNISITNHLTEENAGPNAYADLQLYSKDKSGSLSLRITDSTQATLSAWLKDNHLPENISYQEVMLGSLPAWQVKTTDHIMLGALDHGVLFTVEMPLIEQSFWQPVYEKVVSNFSFLAPETASAQGTSSGGDEILFEGEEVVE
jgi:hypothetical protein